MEDTVRFRRLKSARNSAAVLAAVLTVLAVEFGFFIPGVEDLTEYKIRDPIVLSSDEDFTASNGITGGNGTDGDPYIIDNWKITVDDDPGVLINGTRSHVTVRNIWITAREEWSGVGIVIRDSSNVTIENSTMSYLLRGVQVEGSGIHSMKSISITDANFIGCCYGLVAQNTTGVSIERGEFAGKESIALFIDNCSDAEMLNIEVDGAVNASILVQNSVNMTIESWNPPWHGSMIVVRSNRVQVNGLFFEKIALSYSNNCSITHSDMDMLTLTKCMDTYISHCGVLAGAVRADAVSRIIIEESYFREFIEASELNLMGSGIEFLNNTMSGSVLMVAGPDITLDGNIMRGSTFRADSVDGLEITNNSVSDSDMKIISCSNVSVSENNFSGTIVLGDTSSVEFNHNLMLDVYVDEQSGGVATWDHGYPDGGNYWSDYGGADLMSGLNQDQPGSDGIGDEPYLVAHGWDAFPLMNRSQVADLRAPRTSMNLDGDSGGNGWFNSEVKITFQAEDNIAGVAGTSYNLDSSGWRNYTVPVQISDDGIYQIEYYSVDGVGNIEPIQRWSIKVDTQPPQFSSSVQGEYHVRNIATARVGISVLDDGSGVCRSSQMVYGFSFGSTVPFGLSGLPVGSKVTFYAMDNAGNYEFRDMKFVSSGPHGTWFTVAIIVDLSAVAAALTLTLMARYPPKPPRDDSISIGKEAVEDGYPKYLKRA